MPASHARKNRKESDEFENEKSATSARKRLKFASKPRRVKRGGAAVWVGAWCPACDSRTKKMTTTIAASAGTEANRKMRVYSACVSALRLAANQKINAKPMSGPMIAPA